MRAFCAFCTNQDFTCLPAPVQHVTGMCLSCRQPRAAVSMLQTAAQGKSPARPAAARRGVSEVLTCLPCARLLPHLATIHPLRPPGYAAVLLAFTSTMLYTELMPVSYHCSSLGCSSGVFPLHAVLPSVRPPCPTVMGYCVDDDAAIVFVATWSSIKSVAAPGFTKGTCAPVWTMGLSTVCLNVSQALAQSVFCHTLYRCHHSKQYMKHVVLFCRKIALVSWRPLLWPHKQMRCHSYLKMMLVILYG